MDEEVEKKLQQVEVILEDIRHNTASPWWRIILNGILYGAGAVTGTVLAVFLLGYILSIFGIIPGFAEIAARLQSAMNVRF